MAIAYDFDGTLSPGNMQEYGFMRKLGYKDPAQFWSKCQELAKKQQADSVLAYMKTMLDESAKKGVSFSRKDFRDYGRSVRLFKGVSTWFSRINAYAAERGICIKHYIISSGLKEMIEGTPIAKEFDKIFASSFMYDEKDQAFWAGVAINYTTKTQFLFRINKGCLDINDNKGINHYLPQRKRAVPFSQMVYIGDGTTDIPCMRVVKSSGGYAIAVYQDKKQPQNLIQEGRVNIAAHADYSPNSAIDKYVKSIIDKIVVEHRLKKLEKSEIKEALNTAE
ncbi:MAG: haloacid dehalogenase-like hydrolase [Elusimicrobiaceae bacterium]|nr:haloacid dehalogenase-like hydrolase [Elusimicrobiaceae bacterium]